MFARPNLTPAFTCASSMKGEPLPGTSTWPPELGLHLIARAYAANIGPARHRPLTRTDAARPSTPSACALSTDMVTKARWRGDCHPRGSLRLRRRSAPAASARSRRRQRAITIEVRRSSVLQGLGEASWGSLALLGSKRYGGYWADRLAVRGGRRRLFRRRPSHGTLRAFVARAECNDLSARLARADGQRLP